MLALTRLCHAIGNMMAVQGGGQILNVSSIAAYQPGPWLSTYFASKAYVLHFSEGLREEVKKTGINVSVLCPGITRTGFFEAANMNADTVKHNRHALSPEEVALYTVRALEKNKAIIMPGWRNRWMTRVPRLLSRWMTRKIAASVNKSYCPR